MIITPLHLPIYDKEVYLLNKVISASLMLPIKKLIHINLLKFIKNNYEVSLPENLTDIECTFYNTPWFNNEKAKSHMVILNGTLIDGTSCTGTVVVLSLRMYRFPTL